MRTGVKTIFFKMYFNKSTLYTWSDPLDLAELHSFRLVYFKHSCEKYEYIHSFLIEFGVRGFLLQSFLLHQITVFMITSRCTRILKKKIAW